MAVPDYQTLMLPVLRLTAAGYARVPDMLPRIAEEFQLTPDDMARILPKGRTTTIASNTHWARTYMSKAGLVRPVRRGVFEVTERGKALLAQKPTRIDNNDLRNYSEFREWLARSTGRSTQNEGEAAALDAIDCVQTPSSTPQERIEHARAELEAALADELLGRLLDGTPRFFERAVVRVLIAMGYGGGDSDAAELTGAPGDGGIDGVINEDALGLDRIYVQAKRYGVDNAVQRPAIQQFVGSLNGESATKGVFVTTSSFTKGAVEFVQRVSQRIVLIDGQKLARLMIAHGVGVRPVDTITLSEIDENFFSDE
ncbi:MAG: restriction endonuclease [Rhodobacteraceae bacterium]|nr:MAG: restriction endonuclease [Paracoccaceae bacterium]